MSDINYQLSIAPMVDWSYSHFRVLMHMLAPHALHYTDMQTTGAVLNNPEKALKKHPNEHRTALQLGGAQPDELAKACEMANATGFVEINLNLGCPSDRVQAGHFGACLMSDAALVSRCIKAMKQATNLPVTAKTRIGIDHQDSYSFFRDFCMQLVEAGADTLIIHARKAWLKGLSPHQNRTIPPVQYEYVYQLKQELPNMPIVINGNIDNLADIQKHLQYVDAVMLGRLACQDPWSIHLIHQALYQQPATLSRAEVVKAYFNYCHQQHKLGHAVSVLLKPIYNIVHGQAGAGAFRKKLNAVVQSKSLHQLDETLDFFHDGLVKQTKSG